MLLVAFLLHPLMAALGISFCVFLDDGAAATRSRRAFALCGTPRRRLCRWAGSSSRRIRLGARLSTREPTTTSSIGHGTNGWARWRRCFSSGCCGASRASAEKLLLARFAAAVFAYGVFQQALAMAMLCPPSLVRLTPLQPMRYLHLVLFSLRDDGRMPAGEILLKRSVWRWAVFLLVANGCMFAWQRAEFGGSQHLELPGRAARRIRGCRPLRGSARIRRRTHILRLTRIIWKRQARIITAFARWPSAASWPMQ